MELRSVTNILPMNGSRNGYSSINDESTKVTVQNNDEYVALSQRNKTIRQFSIIGIIFSSIVFVLAFTGNNNDSNSPNLGFVLERSTTYKQVVHPETPSSYWGVVQKPFPTGAFWTNLVVKNGDGPIGVLPYGIKTIETGIQVSYGPSRRVVTQYFISDPFNIDLQISAVQGYVSRSVESYDNSSVTMAYKTNNGGKYKTHLVKGSPFITVVYDNTTPVITSDIMKILDVEAKILKGNDGVQYIITLGNYQKWLLYCSEPIGFSWKENSLIGGLPIHGFIRVSVLPMQNSLESFNALIPYVKKYPTSAIWSFNFVSSSVAEANIQYNTVGTGPLLMLALPHQTTIMQTPNLKSDDIANLQKILNPIYSIKGKMKVVIGEQWKLLFNLVQVGWNYVPSDKLSNSQMDEIARNLIIDVTEVLTPATDPYAFGKQMGRMARLALIADEFGIPNVRQQAILNLESNLLPWLTGSNANALLYDKTWGGLVPTHGLEASVNEFGSGWYSDHHFHYGYFIYALATLAKLDPPFWAANRPAIEGIVRDICNPDPTDPDFPFFRHKDLFDGHSWASGLFQQGNGKGQESSSESINAYYGGYLYGLATGNTELTRMSHVMLTMEIHSTKVYWHMTESSVPDIYDGLFAANRMLGNIGAIDITASTWFGNKFEFVHGINIMPLTPVTSVLLDQEYVKQEWPVLGSRLMIEKKEVPDKYRKCSANKDCIALGLAGNCCPNTENVFLQCCNYTADALGIDVINDEFKSYIYIDQAVIDRDSAWKSIQTHPSFGQGGSRSNSLYWAASRPAPPINYSAILKAPNYASLIPKNCSSNSACNIAGLTGDCCPLSNGLSLGCCSRAITLTPW